jgi:hypothetical protein
MSQARNQHEAGSKQTSHVIGFGVQDQVKHINQSNFFKRGL